MTEPLRLEKRVFWRTVRIQHNIVKASKSVLDLLRSLSLSLSITIPMFLGFSAIQPYRSGLHIKLPVRI